MTITELIAELDALRARHGDLQVGVLDEESGGYTPVVVLGVEPRSTKPGHRDDRNLGPIFVKLRCSEYRGA